MTRPNWPPAWETLIFPCFQDILATKSPTKTFVAEVTEARGGSKSCCSMPYAWANAATTVCRAAPMVVYAAGQLKRRSGRRSAGSRVIVPRSSTRRGALRRRVNRKRKKKMDEHFRAAAWLVFLPHARLRWCCVDSLCLEVYPPRPYQPVRMRLSGFPTCRKKPQHPPPFRRKWRVSIALVGYW